MRSRYGDRLQHDDARNAGGFAFPKHLVLCSVMLTLMATDSAHITTQAAANKPTERIFVAYYESWLGNAKGALDEVLVGLPPEVNRVNLAFMRPDAHYVGALDFSGTGLEFDYPGRVLRNSVQALKQRNPNTKVFVSVGGEEATNWNHLSPADIARFVQDFGLDGVDIDFEPKSPKCRRTEDSVRCASTQLLADTVTKLRSALARPLGLSLTAYNTSAYGEGHWRDAEPTGSESYGMLLEFFRERVSGDIDFLNIMAYDAGSSFDPIQAYEAFQHYFHKPILIGVTPPPEAWGDHTYTPAETTRVIRAALERGAAGAMLFSLRKLPPGTSRNGAQLSPLVKVITESLTEH